MNDLELPAYSPVYPITKNVRPKQRVSKLPSSWGHEQRKTVGQNQTAPEWNVKWILENADANILDEFLFQRANRNESFLWAPPGYPQARYRCDSWTKSMFDLNVSDIQATFVRIFDYDNLISADLDNGHIALDGYNTTFVNGYYIISDTGVFAYSGEPVVFSGSRIIYADVYAFALTGNDATLYKGLASDYFSTFNDQVYGWDRDFQVDWWAD